MRLLDLFSGAGGSAVGYHRAGFEVVGVDIKPQKNYPFEFHCSDAFTFLEKHGHEFDVIHASPPCQAYSEATPVGHRDKHLKLIHLVREALGVRPYIIENVEGAKRELREPFKLCGTMFGLPLWRHRFFESQPSLFSLVPSCMHVRRPVTLHSGSHTRHSVEPVLISGSTRRKGEKRIDYSIEEKRMAMGIDWMTIQEIDQAIPPAYTEWIGQRLLEALT